jgi:DNA repair protein RecN (Recombination protein N)
MLAKLSIKDFAIIDDLTLSFDDGFTVITGETGAGKSILIDAVDLALGGKADRDFVRSGAQEAEIEATFRLPPFLQTQVRTLLDDGEIEYDNVEEITLTRYVRTNGRSTSRINGSVCKLSIYSDVGSLMLDIHGQTENQKLLDARHHIYLLDSFAGLVDTRDALQTVVRRLHKVRREIKNLEQDEAALARRIDVLEYQIQEIEAADLTVGEENQLNEESQRLANAERLLENAQQVEYLLTESDMEHTGAIEQINQIASILGRLVKMDPSVSQYLDLAENLSSELEELADKINDYGESVDVEPGRLNEVEERLAAIGTLKRKYGGSIEDILEFAENARDELNSITNSEERLEELRKLEDDLLHQIGDMGMALSKNRRAASKRLSKLIEEQLQSLRMEAARFDVSIEQSEDPEGAYINGERLAFTQTGLDDVNFMLSTNYGEPLKPLSKVASGGETSRSMLALKSVLSKADKTPTLIFDEVDQGIGGRLGMVIGEKLWLLSLNHQVMVVTHMAQIASFADHHYSVTKSIDKKRTVTHVEELPKSKRVDELAAMLGAEAESSRSNAQDLLDLAAEMKQLERENSGEPVTARKQERLL